MESYIVTGAVSGVATGSITPGPHQLIQVETVDMDIDMSNIGSEDVTVTLSGALTGVYTFHSPVAPKIRFYKDEVVNITTANFSGDYNAIIGYLLVGSQEAWLNTRNMSTIPLPSRLTRRTPRSS